ncbi:hypothetical protein [Macrococcus equipercicus]|uniref:Uncharacterized protein n=1 Tax=Macrococcus equipercicus TaxID=69967 RepID=A0A9Q9F3P9_9STAP|nr:hypothetical protein [Macrococcus equipercicus]KAA1042597.1 hypothetical protein ERX35_001575 [Macrococcus equipercicus]UTH14459.1 hypothetical protein KFV11_03615 [Macrococcus equipercicus]
MNLHVNEIKLVDDSVHVFTEEEQLAVTPAGQLLTDSDHFQFVYLLDDGDVYHHLRFVEETWRMMNEYKEKKWYLYGTIELEYFSEEFTMLLDNIEGNHNYGKPFVERVEEVFEL